MDADSFPLLQVAVFTLVVTILGAAMSLWLSAQAWADLRVAQRFGDHDLRDVAGNAVIQEGIRFGIFIALIIGRVPGLFISPSSYSTIINEFWGLLLLRLAIDFSVSVGLVVKSFSALRMRNSIAERHDRSKV